MEGTENTNPGGTGISAGVLSDLLLLDLDDDSSAWSPTTANSIPRTFRTDYDLALDIAREEPLIEAEDVAGAHHLIREQITAVSGGLNAPPAPPPARVPMVAEFPGREGDQILLPDVPPQSTYYSDRNPFNGLSDEKNPFRRQQSRSIPVITRKPVPRKTDKFRTDERPLNWSPTAPAAPAAAAKSSDESDSPPDQPNLVSRASLIVPCTICESQHKQMYYYCSACKESYCDECWNMQPLHRKRTTSDIPHEKTDQIIAQKLEASLEPNKTEQEQDELHQRDEDTAWFGVVKDAGDDKIFEDYGRFGVLMSESCVGHVDHNRNRYPGLVSFVGETGAGKSTLIKVLIELHYMGQQRFHAPVVGSVKCHQSNPTTGDVHLYIDPHTNTDDYPILYADCEGIHGGERVPMGSKTHKKDLKDKITGKVRMPGSTRSFQKKIRKLHQSSKREITWATSSETKSREFTVLNLYPRLLYTFSDVIVFVHKNPKTLEGVVEKLLMWASQCLEKSTNQPILPHAIIALNAMPNSIDESLWDVKTATDDFLYSVGTDFRHNSKFSEYIRFWKERGERFDSLKKLLLSYYADIKVVYIPYKGRPNLISEQIKKLYKETCDAVTKSRQTKKKMRMLLNAVDIQQYLQSAFDHFACNLDMPFDFVQASFANNPIELDFGGHILKLAIRVMEVCQNYAKDQNMECIIEGSALFRRMSRMVASCIMLDSAKNRIGGPDIIFQQYIDPLDDALEDFCDKYWPCEFISPKGAKCNNVKSGHSKGHQSKSARVIGLGEYKSSFSFDSYRDTFREGVYFHLRDFLATLQNNVSHSKNELSEAFRIHRENNLRRFYESVGGAANFISHSACFSCLVEPPQHQLPCGHIFCSTCIMGYGTKRHKHVVELRACPLHEHEATFWVPHVVYLKPPGAGIRILTLDGGGVRGIIELGILLRLEQALGGKLPISLFFDLIVGTSTGGIVGLGLGAMGWSVGHCTEKFKELCGKAFTRRKFADFPGVRHFVRAHYHSAYETNPLQAALKEAFTEEEYLFGGAQTTDCPKQSTKVAVTSVLCAGSKPAVLANYNRTGGVDGTYHFQRPERLDHELKIWEAARATSAAPTYFKPFPHEASKHGYMDGGIFHNNPINIADAERKLIWPEISHQHPDLILSVGSGYNPNKREALELEKTPKTRVGAWSHLRTLYQICVDHIHSSLDSEQSWKNYLGHVSPREWDEHRFQRLNVPLTQPDDPPHLDDVESLTRLERAAKVEMNMRRAKTQLIADHLICTCFYFEKHKCVSSDDGFICYGSIQCRVPQKGVEMEHLGNFLRQLRFDRANNREWCPYFIIEERGLESSAEQVTMSNEVIENMRHRREFHIDPVRVKLSNENAVTKMSLCLAGDKDFLISGFPRELLLEDKQVSSTQPRERHRPKRWRSRGQSDRRGIWTSPVPRLASTVSSNMSVQEPIFEVDSTAVYAELPGDTTWAGVEESIPEIDEIDDLYAPGPSSGR